MRTRVGRLATLVVTGLLVGGSPVFAQVPTGLLEAANNADPVSSAAAQYSLGLMYATGAGVPQNYQRAYMWFSLEVAGQSAADRDIAVINRDRASEYLTPEQLSLAQVQATRCFNSNFTDCGEPD